MVTDFLSSIDASSTVLDFIKLKKDNKHVNKTMVTLLTKSIGDIIVGGGFKVKLTGNSQWSR